MRQSWATPVEDYLTTKELAGQSAGTVKLHRYYLTRLAQFTTASPLTVNRQCLVEFLTASGWAPETRRAATSVVRTFFGWLVDNDYRADNPAVKLPRVKLPDVYARPVPDAVIRETLDRIRKDKHRHQVLLAAECALRCAEIAAIEAEWWDGDARVLHIVGKGGKRRQVPVLNPELVARLDQLVASGERYLFPSAFRVGEHIHAASVTQILRDYLPGAWSAHKLRTRAATTVYAATGDLRIVQEMLGHSKPETTTRYIKLPADRLAAAMASAAL